MAKGIIMSPVMASALWQGRKTQTRRLATNKVAAAAQVGDTFWVRESFHLEIQFDALPPRYLNSTQFKQMPVWYVAQGAPSNESAWGQPWGRRRASIHMPRWASRMALRVTDIRKQLLHDISEDDAKAEGVVFKDSDPPFCYVPGLKPFLTAVGIENDRPAACSFGKLWDLFNKKARWQSNPEIIALSFDVQKNTTPQFGGYNA